MNRRFHTLDRLEIQDQADRSVKVIIKYFPKGWDMVYGLQSVIAPQVICNIGRNDAVYMEACSMCARSYMEQWKRQQLWEEVEIVLEESYNIKRT